MMNSASTVVFAVPTFQTISEASTVAMQKAAVISPAPTEELGEYFAYAVAEQKAVADMRTGEVVIVPLSAPPEGGLADFTFLATAPLMYIKVTGTPQALMTYGVCWVYSAGVENPSVDIGTNVKLQSLPRYVVAREGAVESIREIHQLSLLGPEGPSPKRVCSRQPVVGGELGDGITEAGMSAKQLVDLNRNKYQARSKNEVVSREKNLNFVFRALNPERWYMAMGGDFSLQTEDYMIMITEQGRTRSELRHKAYLSCGILDRVRGLSIFASEKKMSFFLTGNVLVNGSSATLSLEDFMGVERIYKSQTISVMIFITLIFNI